MRRSTYLAGAAILALPLGITAARRPTHADVVPICVIAANWVEMHRSDLPVTFERFAKFPAPYQRAIFNALSVPQRETLWRQHLEGASTAKSWTPAQAAFLSFTIADLHYLFDPAASTVQRRARWQAHWDRGLPVLGLDTSRRLFTLKGMTHVGRDMKECNCKVGSPSECADCTPYNDSNCMELDTGCGPGGTTGCDGWCAQ